MIVASQEPDLEALKRVMGPFSERVIHALADSR
jgi:hypothetical protein